MFDILATLLVSKIYTQVVLDNVMYIIFWFENGRNLSNLYINNEIKIGE